MTIDVSKIKQARQPGRAEAESKGVDVATVHELRHIADALEAIRGELAGLAHLAGNAVARIK